VVWFAYFPPYSWERHQDLLGSLATSPLVHASVMGHTAEGRDLDVYRVGHGPSTVWVIARQHPGEPQAEWFAEGFLKRLTDRNDALARQVPVWGGWWGCGAATCS
jgi:murein tripeptide amidase MpaA